ncbi:MAG: protein kinase [Planctomycetes bacterium]|nr:protein kinase [Planctomycetota bacterium]
MAEQKPDPLSALHPTFAVSSIPPNTGTGSDTGVVPSATEVAAPAHIGQYLLLGELGRGGMGVVYRAEDPHLKREVALKVMLPQFASNATAKARFVREARAQAKVEHEHVAVIHQVAEHDGLPYIVMPLLKGMTLHAALRANPRPPISEVVRIAREMAEGLAAAHESGLVHRDIKPANIWLEGKKLRVRLLDFGLARIAVEADGAEQDNGPVTREGALIGTPAYMSPEQARGNPVDGRTDLWSLGVILYQMTSGELPFNGPTTITILTSLSLDTPVTPVVKNPAVPPELSALIMRLLAKDPAHRPPTAEILADELRAIETSVSGLVRVVSLEAVPAFTLPSVGADPFAEIDATETSGIAKPIEPTQKKARSESSRQWLYAAGGAAFVALLLVLGVVSSLRAKKPPVEVAHEELITKVKDPPLIPKIKPKDPPKLETPTDPFREVHGVNAAELKAWITRLNPGYRPSCISVRGGTAETIFDAVAIPETREWHFVTTAGGLEQPVFDDYSNRGFMAKVRLAHLAEGQFMLSEVWVREKPNPWTSWNGPRASINAKLKEALTTERIPIQLSCVTEGERQFFGVVVFARPSSLKWEAALDLQLNDLVRRVGECNTKGWRPKTLAAVCDSSRVRFSATFAENQPPVGWEFQSALSITEYEKALVERKEKRQRPGLVASYVADGKVSYAVVWEDNVDPDTDRRVAIALKSTAFSLTLRVGWNSVTIKRDDPLPDGAFELTGISFFDNRVPPDFMSKTLLPLVADLRHLNTIHGLQTPVTADDLNKLAGSASATNLTDLGFWECELTPDTLAAFKKFPNLASLGCSAKMADDEILSRLKELPKVTSLALRGLDTRGKAGDRGLEAITNLPLRSLSLWNSDLSSQHYRGIADMPNLTLLDLSGGTTTDACVADLVTCAKLQRLTLTGTKITDKALESVEKITPLRILDVWRTKVSMRALQNLVTLRPDLRVSWNDGLIEAKKP